MELFQIHKRTGYESFQQDETSGTTQRRQASWWERQSPLLAIILSFALGCVPAALNWSHTTFSSASSLYTFSTQNRASLQVVITILASIFAFFWTWSLGAALELFLRLRLANSRLSIDQLRLCYSTSTRSFNTDLPWRLFPIPVVVAAIFLIPAWLWTGAITPQVVVGAQKAYISTVQVGTGSYPFLGDYNTFADIAQGCFQVSKFNSTFSNCPGRRQSGSILQSMGTASTAPGVQRNHSKLDNSGYQYLDRSYGIGASTGLQDPPRSSDEVLSFNFTEIGYLTSAKCVYNQSADFNLSQNVTADTPGIPAWFWQQGRRPNERWDQPPPGAAAHANFGTDPSEVVGWSAGSCCGHTNGTGPFYISIAAGGTYNFLNTTQCELFFEPTAFNVAVSVANRTIHVTPSNVSTYDLNPAGYLRQWTLRALASLPLIETTLYVSSIGENFISNAQMKLNQPNFDASIPNNEAALPAVEDSLVAALDDILEALGGYAFTNTTNTEPNIVTVQVTRLQIGSRSIIIALFAVNVVGLIAVCGLAVYTRGYHATPAFNFMEIGAIMAAVSYGNGSLSNRQDMSSAPAGPNWDGDPQDTSLKHISVEMNTRLGESEAPSVRLRSRTLR